jgi:DNA primase
MSDLSAQIREKVSLKELVERTVTLKPRGVGKYVGKSPFSNEKTASFYVDDTLGIWKDFSSNKGGGVIKYLQEKENYSVKEAIEFLKDTYGIVTEDKPENKEHSLLRACLKDCQTFFRKGRDTAVKYVVETRGYSEEIVDKYGLGYAPNDYKNLVAYLIKKGHTKETIVKAGMAYWDNKRQGEIVPRHVDKLMFPIKDKYNNIISFSGRRLDERKEGKYILGSNSPLFKKEAALYNIDIALKMSREQERMILVEGQFDAIMLTEAGFPAVAIFGASISDWQLSTVARSVPNIYMMFDSDAAGRKALLHAFKKIEEEGHDCISYALTVPSEFKDASDLFAQEGSEGIAKLVNTAIPDNAVVLSLIVDEAKKTTSKNSSMARKVLEQVKPFFSGTYTYRNLDMLDRLSEYLNLDRKQLDKWIKDDASFKHNSSVYKKLEAIEFPAPIYEKRILMCCIKSPLCMKVLKGMGIGRYDFESPLVSKCLVILDANKDRVMEAFEEELTPEEYDLVTTAYMTTQHEEINITSQGAIMIRKKNQTRGPENFTSILGRPLKYSEKESKNTLVEMLRQAKG